MTDYSLRIKSNRRYSNAELLAAVQNVAKECNCEYVSGRLFERATGISEGTILGRFGSWREFCGKAGLQPRYTRGVKREELLHNLDSVWRKLGRQPAAKEMKQPVSPISISQYSRVFGKSWHHICAEFLSWKSGLPGQSEKIPSSSPELIREGSPRKEPRSISLSMRYEVLKRDGFKCVICGASPVTHHGCVLHIDHIEHWAKGGKANPANLRTLCSNCNLGRGMKE